MFFGALSSRMKRPPPRKHPGPYASQLWPHLESIRTLRRRRKTWRAITKHLDDACGIKLGVWTVRNFFKRATIGRDPLGFTNTERTRDLQKASPALTEVRRLPDPAEESAGDPFSTKAIPLNPWKPSSATYE
jgi:hypothetical protein